MTTYKYTDTTNTVVHIIDDDGISRSSCLVSILPEGSVIEPADPPPYVDPASLPAQITVGEWESVSSTVMLMQDVLNALAVRVAKLEKTPK